MVEVEVGGRKFQVAPEAAEAFRAREEELLFQAQQPPREVTPPPRRPEPASPPPASAEPENIQERLFLDPQGVLDEYRQKIIEEVRNEYTQEKSREAFWTTFYKTNPDLEQHDFVVKAVLARDWGELEGLTGQEALDQLANRTKAAILGFAGSNTKKGNDTQTLEGGSTRTPPNRGTQTPAKDETPYGLSAAIRARRKNRRAV